MFTAVVVLPTPPFGFARTITRVRTGRGSGSPTRPASTRRAVSAARAMGVSSPCSGLGHAVVRLHRFGHSELLRSRGAAEQQRVGRGQDGRRRRPVVR